MVLQLNDVPNIYYQFEHPQKNLERIMAHVTIRQVFAAGLDVDEKTLSGHTKAHD
jgi:hypothetical protein